MSQLTNPLTVNVGDRLALVAKGWAYLEKLYTRRLFLKQVADEVGKKPSQASLELGELSEGGLVASAREGRRVYYSLTDSGRHAVETGRNLLLDTTPVHLRQADSSEVSFLLGKMGKIRSSHSESVDEAEGLLLEIARTSRFSKSDAEKVLSTAKRFLSDNHKVHWSRWLWILKALSSGDDATLRRIQQYFTSRLLDIVAEPEVQGPAREVATGLARELLGRDEWYSRLRELVESKARKIPANKNDLWAAVEDAFIPSLKEMYGSNRMVSLKWLFGLIETDNASVKQRAQNLIQRLKG